MQFKPVMNKTVLYADNSKSHASLGYLQKNPWNVHAPLLLFLYPESISALFIYSVIDRGAKCWTTLRDQIKSSIIPLSQVQEGNAFFPPPMSE